MKAKAVVVFSDHRSPFLRTNSADREGLISVAEVQAASHKNNWQPDQVYLGLMVTVNELLEMFVSVPPNVAEPVVENVPACSGTKLTVTIKVWPPGRLARLQVRVPPNVFAGIPPHVP